MKRPPRITIVTPSYNQGPFIAETIESIASQGYPDLEHIVMDGGSTDDTLEILKRYPHLVVVSERDRGQADAINKGFARATGDIWGFVNSDDTLLPGALQRVAEEIDPDRGRDVVVGRCLFIDEHGKSLGIEHPCGFESFERVLAIWKGHTIPQPSVFWTPEVWRRCGGMDLALKYHLDYELFCRFSRHYRFHPIDQVLSTYRLHAESKTEGWTEADRLQDSIGLSRRYWGPAWSPRRWRLEASLAWHRFDRIGRARRLYLAGQEMRRQGGGRLRALPRQAAAACLAPEVAFYSALYPQWRERAAGWLAAPIARRMNAASPHLETQVYLSKSDTWPDRWAGPRLCFSRVTPDGATRVSLYGAAILTHLPDGQDLTLFVDGRKADSVHLGVHGRFIVDFQLPGGLPGGTHDFEIRARHYFVHHHFAKSGDWRPLSWRVVDDEYLHFPNS
jgi:glycosyltransferase involved in cell wall biosynthesis